MSFQVIIDRLNEEEKARARNIYERYAVGDKVSVDELRLLLRFEKSQLSQARISQHDAKRALASNQFEQINYKDHSLAGWIKKGLLGVSTAKSQIKSSSIDYHISGLEKLVNELEIEIEKRSADNKNNQSKSNENENIFAALSAWLIVDKYKS
ncbi:MULTISPECIES: hypothetical protein [Campylobacter]|uniref:hypothetical protein n=2 Tax=Campylobacteraceae TaxID=72294 RepID=UPI00112F2C9B|nr:MULTISPECIES: hypothetical protein [unclassified Campylobacter]